MNKFYIFKLQLNELHTFICCWLAWTVITNFFAVNIFRENRIITAFFCYFYISFCVFSDIYIEKANENKLLLKKEKYIFKIIKYVVNLCL